MSDLLRSNNGWKGLESGLLFRDLEKMKFDTMQSYLFIVSKLQLLEWFLLYQKNNLQVWFNLSNKYFGIPFIFSLVV